MPYMCQAQWPWQTFPILKENMHTLTRTREQCPPSFNAYQGKARLAGLHTGLMRCKHWIEQPLLCGCERPPTTLSIGTFRRLAQRNSTSPSSYGPNILPMLPCHMLGRGRLTTKKWDSRCVPIPRWFLAKSTLQEATDTQTYQTTKVNYCTLQLGQPERWMSSNCSFVNEEFLAE